MEAFADGGLVFDVDDRGPLTGEAVILLHGFPADRTSFAGVAERLAAAGYRTFSPDQRGYSPGARPPARRAYTVDRLAADALALADAAGSERFHLAGHDWGAAVAWHLAAHRPERVATLTALSVPHPGALREAAVKGDQALRSWYVLAFQVPGVEHLLAAGGGERLRRGLERSGLGPASARRYAARASTAADLRGPLAWYRALPWTWTARLPMPPVRVPTLLIRGSGDPFLGATAAAASARWARGPYEFVEVEGSHWLPEEHPDEVAGLMLGLLRANPIRG